MLVPNYEIYIEQLDELCKKTELEADFLKYNVSHVISELWNNSDWSNRKPRRDRLISLLRLAREDYCNTIRNIQMIVDALDEIEDEATKHEINNAGQ